MGSRPAHAGGVVAVAGALPMEVAGLRRLGSFDKAAIDGIKYLQGDVRGVDAALFVSGIGEKRAYETARAACLGLDLSAYISVGLSGSLSSGLKTGDVVIGERIRTLASKGHGEYRCDPGLLGLATRAFADGGMPALGPLLAAERVLVSRDEKTGIARSYDCLAVDMESAGAARAAKQAGVPFIAIRAISDALHEDMPVDFNRFTVDGCMDWSRFIFHVLAHPATIGPLMRLGRNSRLAAANLARAVASVLENMRTETSPEGQAR